MEGTSPIKGKAADPVTKVAELDVIKSSVDKLVHPIKDIFVDGGRDASEVVIKFLAHLVQSPEEKPEMALNIVTENPKIRLLMKFFSHYIIGQNYVLEGSPRTVLRAGNCDIENKLLIVLDNFDLLKAEEFDLLNSRIKGKNIVVKIKGGEKRSVTDYARYIVFNKQPFDDNPRFINIKINDRNTAGYLNLLEALISKKDPNLQVVADFFYTYLMKHVDISDFRTTQLKISKQ